MGFNLLPNSSFIDINADGTPDGFTKVGNGTLAVSTASLNADIGGNALSITASTTATGISYTKSTREAQEYTISFYYRSVLPAHLVLTITQYNGTLVLDTDTQTVGTGHNAQMISQSFTMLPTSNQVKVQVNVHPGSDVVLIGNPCMEIGDSTDGVGVPTSTTYEPSEMPSLTKLDDLSATDDNTDLDSSDTAHGLLPKLSGTATEALLGDGTWGAPAPAAHKDSHDPEDGSDALDAAAPENIDGVQAAAEGTSHSFARADHAHRIQAAIADDAIITMDLADAASGEYVRMTATGIESRQESEVKADLNLEIGTDVLAQQTIGIADDNLVEMDDAGPAQVGEYVRLTANGLEGRPEASFKEDYNLEIGTDVLAQQTIGIADDNLLEVDSADAANGEYAKFTAAGIESKSIAEVLGDLSVESGADVTDAANVATAGAVMATQAINNNLLLNPEFQDCNADNVPDFWALLATPTVAIAANTLVPALKGNQITITGNGAGNEGIVVQGAAANWLKVKPSGVYTFSFWYKVTAGDTLTYHIHSYNDAAEGTAEVTVTDLAATTATLVPVTFTTDADANNLHIEFDATLDTDVAVIAAVKLEEGPIATQYVPPSRDRLFVSSIVSSATPAPVCQARRNEFIITALGEASELAAPTTTDVFQNGDTLVVRIEDDATGRALTYNAIYEVVGVTLPVTTVASKKMYLGFVYNLTDTKWDCLSVNEEA